MSSVPAACVSESCRCCCSGRSRDNVATVVVRRRRCVSKNGRMENHNVCINKSMPKMFAKKIYREQRPMSRYCSQLYTFHIVRTRIPGNMYTASAVRGTFIKTKDRFFSFHKPLYTSSSSSSFSSSSSSSSPLTALPHRPRTQIHALRFFA